MLQPLRKSNIIQHFWNTFRVVYYVMPNRKYIHHDINYFYNNLSFICKGRSPMVKQKNTDIILCMIAPTIL